MDVKVNAAGGVADAAPQDSFCGAQPAQPAGPYRIGVDSPGGDVAPCGTEGCVLKSGATYKDCEATCTAMAECQAYVFATANCSGASGPICWTKSGLAGDGGKATSCRNSRQIARPATNGMNCVIQKIYDQSPQGNHLGIVRYSHQ